MRPAPFTYSKPTTVTDALSAMADGAVPLAGGQSLLQAMRLRTAEPAAVVDIGAIETLDANIVLDSDTLAIGALVTHRQLLENPTVAAEFPWLHDAAAALGDVQVRNRGTVLGNVCWADPRANFAVAMLASNAVVTVAAAAGATATIPVDSFFSGFRAHTLGPRLATSLRVPRIPGARGVYREFSRQRQDLALCNVCIVRAPAATRIAIGGIHATPVRLPAIEQQVTGRVPVEAAAVAAAVDALDLAPLTDQHGSAAYKRHLAVTLVMRALGDCNRKSSHG